jgi:DNA-binding IclR family transcriptional regulator
MVHASKLIGSVQRAIDILNLFDNQAEELGTTEIARSLNLHKSTVASLVYTLEANGYLTQNMKTRKYRLGFKLAERVSVMLNHLQIRQVVYPFLQELHQEFNETINLGMLDGASVVYIERLQSTRPLGMRSEIGRRTLAHSTALGKAMLACLSPTELNAFIACHGLPALTQNTITEPRDLLEELEKTRQLGYAVDNEENEIGGRCTAAPIFDQTGRVVAAVSISLPTARLPVTDFPIYGSRIRDVARAVSRSLGYQYSSF